jgi:hypothetical protein
MVIALTSAAVPLVAQTAASPTAVIVQVVNDLTHDPLPSAQVIDVSIQRGAFTNTAGEVSIATAGRDSVRLRVRQVGFEFVERTFAIPTSSGSQPARILVPLHPISYSLPKVTTQAINTCGAASDSVSGAVSASVLAQLRLGAERYDAFRRAYPFNVWVERSTTQRDSEGNMVEDPLTTAEEESERWGNSYSAGHVFNATKDRSFTVPILFVTALAAPEFWAHHCFSARGVQALNHERVIRLDFSPTTATRTPDWEGSAYLDSATSMLRRVDFQIVNFRQDDVLYWMSGYTTFNSPTAFIAMPDSTVAKWVYRLGLPYNYTRRPIDGFQSLIVRRLVYRDSVPPKLTH